MSKKQRKFADDGWAVWIDGDDTSTVYINDWIDPEGKSYIDLGIRIRGVKSSKNLYVYVPYELSRGEMEDISLLYKDTRILQATFSAVCIVDYMKNEHTSEIAYNGKTVDIVHISTMEYDLVPVSQGTRINLDLEKLQPFLDNDEAYIIWRMPHKTLDDIFKWHVDGETTLTRLRDLVTSPVVQEKYGYSVRINEARLLPEGITRVGAFHRQKLKKAVITISLKENYEINDSGCYRIRRLEENLYTGYIPEGYQCEDVITYEWNQNREHNLRGQFNFYNSITKNRVSRVSMLIYLMFVIGIGVVINYVSNTVFAFFGWF
ncbi:MAG: hypothetical protein IKT48_01015 [Anaerotignum sp.]|nr:hypothetical protein [Anaerotignum sp.]MBR5794248.1 hypothetical protein [Anaerotignum sp.]